MASGYAEVVARAAAHCVERAVGLAESRVGDEFGEYLLITAPNLGCELTQGISVATTGFRKAKSGELLRVDFDLDYAPFSAPVFSSFKMALFPFLECRRDLVFHETPKGCEISIVDKW